MMIYQWPRRAGKTFYLLEWLEMNPKGAMLTFSCAERDRLRREYPIQAARIFSADEWLDGRCLGRDIEVLAIDNVDILLASLFRCRIGPVTATENLRDQT